MTTDYGFEISQLEYDNVCGVNYEKAMTILRQERELYNTYSQGHGFLNRDTCEKAATSLRLDTFVYRKSLGSLWHIDHLGRVVSDKAFTSMYGNVFYYMIKQDGENVKVVWKPDATSAMYDAKLAEESGAEGLEPLYFRDNFLPSRYYDAATGMFNVAEPFPVHAKNTGCDIWYIYELLKHISGECYPWVLRWLREKMIHPEERTEVCPVFISADKQGTGKSTFGKVICKAVFGDKNVVVTDKFDSGARFNSDVVDKLLVCIEEKPEGDAKNTLNQLKSLITADTVRKEIKGVDPYYQKNYIDLCIFTNDLVAIKFDAAEQRRFMVMDCDPTFTRETSDVAEEVFTTLYAEDKHKNKVGIELLENPDHIAQFKWDLLQGKDCTKEPLANFPKTAAYHRQFNLARTNESVGIEATVRMLLPFIKSSVEAGQVIAAVDNEESGMTEVLSDIADTNAFAFLNTYNLPPCLCLNRDAIFVDNMGKLIPQSTLEKTVAGMRQEFEAHGVTLLMDFSPKAKLFTPLHPKLRQSKCFLFTKYRQMAIKAQTEKKPVEKVAPVVKQRQGQRVRYSDTTYMPDPYGAFETLNEILPGQPRTKDNALYMDTFLLEADEAAPAIKEHEKKKLEEYVISGSAEPLRAETLYSERLQTQQAEADRLFYKERCVARVVYSGNKSLHMIVRVDIPPTNEEERMWLDSYLKSTLSRVLEFDPSTKDATRLTRAPVNYTRTITKKVAGKDVTIVGQQKLIYEDWNNTYKVDWRPVYNTWKTTNATQYHPLEKHFKKRVYPTKPEYIDAAYVFASANFFTHEAFNGKRQELFFPAYRILRELGISKDAIFDELDKQVMEYAKTEDIQYWKDRRNCKLIRTIEEEFNV